MSVRALRARRLARVVPLNELNGGFVCAYEGV